MGEGKKDAASQPSRGPAPILRPTGGRKRSHRPQRTGPPSHKKKIKEFAPQSREAAVIKKKRAGEDGFLVVNP